MKTKIKWFVLGFLASWLTWSVISYIRLHPRDLTAKWPDDVQKVFGDNVPWLRSAVARNVGNFVVCASAEKSNASATISPRGQPFPQVFMTDVGMSGAVDSIILTAAGHQSISVDMDTDGRFRKYTVSTGDLFDTNSVAMVDSDMNGEFDIKIGPGRHIAVWINSAWRERVATNGQHFITLDGVMTEVVNSNGVWKVKE